MPNKMPKTVIQEESQKTEDKKSPAEEGQQLSQLVKDVVMQKLGKPKMFSHTDVIHLWDDHFRVNVWCHKDDKRFSMNIVQSFHVVATADGIVRSNPEIK